MYTLVWILVTSPMLVSFSTHAAAAHHDALAQGAAFAHAGVVADDRSRRRWWCRDRRPRRSTPRSARPAPAAAARRAWRCELGDQRGHLAEHDVVLDEAAVADHGVVVHDHVGAERHVGADARRCRRAAGCGPARRRKRSRRPDGVVTGRPPSRRRSSMASSTLTTLSASRPSVSGCWPLRMQSTKCWHSIAQRLVVADLGDVDVAEVQRDVLAVGLELAARAAPLS